MKNLRWLKVVACFSLSTPSLWMTARAGADDSAPRIEFDHKQGIWNPLPLAPDNQPQVVKVLVLNYDPIAPGEGYRPLTRIFGWANAATRATEYKELMERASGGYLRFEIVEWRNLNDIYALQGGYRYTIEEYVRNRRSGKGWRKDGQADYPGLLREQNVVPLVDEGLVDEVWIFSDHFFGLWEASMAGPRSFFINGGVYPRVPSQRPFAFYGFNYERGTAEMAHNTSHRTECTMNRVYGNWNLKSPTTNWDRFSANHDQSGGVAGVGTCHWPPNAKGDYDYGNERQVLSWADDFFNYPRLTGERKPVSRDTWTDGDPHRGYMRWYFAHLPRAVGVNADGRQNNWWKYLYDFDNYAQDGKAKPAAARLQASDLFELGGAGHEIRVAYQSPVPIDVTSLGDDDLAVTGPRGAAMKVKFLAASDPRNGTHRVASYRIATPGGAWKESDRGAYSVALTKNAVKDATGRGLEATMLGSFSVSSSVGLERLRIEPKELKLGVSQRAVVRAFTDGPGDASRDVTPVVRWSVSKPEVASVDHQGTLIALAAGKTKATAVLGTLQASLDVTIEGSELPVARLLRTVEPPREGQQAVMLEVEYSDRAGIDAASLDLADLRVAGPNGFQQFPALRDHKATGKKMLATYALAPPSQGWQAAPRGTYAIEVKAWQVHASEGRFVAEGKLGTFELK